MTTVADVKLWGVTIGAVSIEDGRDVASFQYDGDFIESGVRVAPLMMPPSTAIYTFPSLPRDTFKGLPGMLADALPDRFGTNVINAWLAQQGRPVNWLNVVERLCYVGTRGMGALEFLPARGPDLNHASALEVEHLVELASSILSKRNALHTSLSDGHEALLDILRVGTSAGGARAKAVIAWNPVSKRVRSGQAKANKGYEYWLIKFDGVSGNGDHGVKDPKGFGTIEYAYYRMATDAGIEMSPSQLYEEHGRRHFMTKRFDRTDDGDKLHMQSLCAIAHFDFNQAGAYSYEQALRVAHELGLGMDVVEQLYRRMVFNIVARNQDDHVKNIGFLMDRNGRWSLAPAFDVVYAYNPQGMWTSRHQMSVNGARENFTLADLDACARSASIKRSHARDIVHSVVPVVEQWTRYADEAGVQPRMRDQIKSVLRTSIVRA